MKILRHSSEKKFIFIPSFITYFEIYVFDLKKNKITYHFREAKTAEKNQKKLSAYIKKEVKNGYTEEAISNEIKEKVNDFTKNLLLEKKYCFLLKKPTALLKSFFTDLRISTKIENWEYFLHYFNEDFGFQNLKEHFAKKIVPESQYYDAHKLKAAFRDRLYMLFTMGFEFYEEAELRILITKKTLNESLPTDAPFIEVKNSNLLEVSLNNKISVDTIYIRHHFYREQLTVKTSCFYIKDKKIVYIDDSYNIAPELEPINQIIDYITETNAASNNFGEQLNETDFYNKFSLNLKPIETFVVPEKKDFVLPTMALNFPAAPLKINQIIDSNIVPNALYFYANTEDENPLDWNISFVAVKNLEQNSYVFSKIIKLRDFNTHYKALESEEFKYNSDLEELFTSLKKKLKKRGLTPIKTQKIFEILSNTQINELVEQPSLEVFETEKDYNKEVIEVFSNYANVRLTNDFKGHYLQFFESDQARENWLLEQKKATVSLYPYQFKELNGFAESIETNLIISHIKDKTIRDYDSLRSFTDYEKKTFFKANFQLKENWYHKGNLTLNQEQSIYIKGDFTVEETLYLAPIKGFNDPYFIVDGTLKVKNLIIERGFDFFFVQNLIVENIVVMAAYCARKFLPLHSSAAILVYPEPVISKFNTNLTFNKEVSIFSEALQDKYKLLKEEQYYFNFPEIVSVLNNNKPFLQANFEEAAVDTEKALALDFETNMKDWSTYYYHFAGCEYTNVYHDSEIVGNAILPDAGDWVVNDIRGNSGTYGYSHEDASIVEVTVKKPKKFGINYDVAPKKLTVSAIDLMYRYQWMSNLFTDWTHRDTVSPYQYWDTKEQLDTAYQTENIVFAEDPHLALYWLLHFGLSIDNRYNEVKETILKLDLGAQLSEINMVIAFFNKHTVFYDMEISGSSASDDEDKLALKHIFLKRRSYLIYKSHVYDYRGGKAFLDQGYTSLSMYTIVDNYSIQKIRWFANNLQKYKNWEEFDRFIENKNTKEIPLFSYVMALHPSSKTTSLSADQFLTELAEGKDIWGVDLSCKFAQKMLWELRFLFTDKSQLETLVNFYFRGDVISEEYEDVKGVLGEKNLNLKEVRKVNNKLLAVIEDFDSYSSDKIKATFFNKIKSEFDLLDTPLLFRVVDGLNEYELQKRAFHYLITENIVDKRFATSDLLLNLNLDEHRLQEIFASNLEDFKLPQTTNSNENSTKNTSNLALVTYWLATPIINHYFNDEDFSENNFPLQKIIEGDKIYTNVREIACFLLEDQLHVPSIFKFVMETLEKLFTQERNITALLILEKLFSKHHYPDRNHANKLNKEQIEIVLNFSLQTIASHPTNETIIRAMARVLEDCENPAAIDWVENEIAQEPYLKLFENIAYEGEKITAKEINQLIKPLLNKMKKQIKKIIV